MNILVIHETEYIEKVVFEYQIIPELWSSWGHNVYVIDFPTNLDKKGFFDLGSLKTKISKNIKKSDKKKGITLIRPGYIKLPVISRLTAWFTHYFAIKKAIVNHKIDVIYLFSVPTNGVQTVLLAKKYKIPVHFRLLDVLHKIVPYKILSYPTYMMEKKVYRRVAELSAVTPRLTEYAVKMGANPKTSFYLPTGSDLDLFYPQPKDRDLVNKFGIEKKHLVLAFAGTLYNFSGLDLVVTYLGENKKKYSDVKLLIMGRGEQSATLEKLIKRYSLQKNVIMTGFVQYEVLPKYINLADICINPFEINGITNLIFPGKIYQYLACGKPVVATKLAGMTQLFPDRSGKNNIFYFDLEDIAGFYKLLDKVKSKVVRDDNPSVQDIARVLEKKLKNLVVA